MTSEIPPPGRGRAGAILALVLCLGIVGLGLFGTEPAARCGCDHAPRAATPEDGGPWVQLALLVGSPRR